MRRRDFGAGAVGALVGAVVIVGVYEGKVRVSHGEDAVTVAAGERVVVDERGVRGAGIPAVAGARPKADEDAGRTVADLRDRLSAIEQEKAALETELAAANDAVGRSPYDMSPEDWAKLAEEGGFKYQLPCFRPGGFRPTDEQLGKLGLAPKDAEAIQAAYRRSNERFGVEMTAVCKQQFPNEPVDMKACVTKLFTTLYSEGDARTTYRTVAEIRAGKRALAPDADAHTRMLYVFSGGMKPFEDDLAATFGADHAHRIAYSDELCFQANTFK